MGMGEEITAGAGRWEGQAYASHSAHHRAVDDSFVQRCPPEPADEVVDAGCGSGEFTVRLAGLVPDGRVVGVEPDPSMLASAREHAGSNVEFRQGTLQELDQVCVPASADLAVSRAAFHWVPWAEYPRCYEAILRVLKPGGWFHAESGGVGNLTRVGELLDDIAAGYGLGPGLAVDGDSLTFPDTGLVLEALEEVGFSVPEGGVGTVAQRRSFDRDALLGFLRTQASAPYLAKASPEVGDAFLGEIETRADELRRHDGTYDQTFVRLEVLCQRPVDA